MTATITTVQTAILTALQTIAGATSPAVFVPSVNEIDPNDMPNAGATTQVYIGYESSSRLARTGSTILEQYLVPITILRRFADDSQTSLTSNHALAESLRDSMASFHNDTMRVDQLLSPHPYDAPKLTGPGLYVHQFVLDMDVLRSVAPITQDVATPTKILTSVRRAAWDALNHWPEWDADTWTRKYYQDADLDELALHDPGEFDLPALAITWGPTSPRFFVHTAQEFPATINVTAWFPAHQTTLAEYRAQQIIRAIYQCADPATPRVSYIRAATGRIPEKDSPISIEPVELGRSQQLKALKLTCQFVITGIVSPMTD